MYRSNPLRNEIWNSLLSTNNNGHVCLSCRAKALAATAQQRRWSRKGIARRIGDGQRRHNSTEAEDRSASTGAATADFFEGFNDLSEEYATATPKPKKKTKPVFLPDEQRIARKTGSAHLFTNDADSKDGGGSGQARKDLSVLREKLAERMQPAPAKSAFARQAPAPAGQGNRNTRHVKARKARRKEEERAALAEQQGKNAMERLKAQLAVSTGGAVEIDGAKKAGTVKVVEEKVKSEREQFEEIMAALERPGLVLPGPDAAQTVAKSSPAPRKAAARKPSPVDVSKLGIWEAAAAAKHAPTEPLDDEDEDAVYEDKDAIVHASDNSDVPSAAPSSSAQALPRKRTETPDFPFPSRSPPTAAVHDDVTVEKGITAFSLPGRQTDPVRYHSSDHKPSSITFSMGAKRDPQSLSAKIEEAKGRPAWGGLVSSPASTPPAKTSFQSLRVADKKSPPKPRARTAGETTAWGSEPVAADFESDSPGDVAEAKVAKKQEGPVKSKGFLQSVLSPSFTDLKRRLGLEVGKSETNVAVESSKDDGAEAGWTQSSLPETVTQAVVESREPAPRPVETESPKPSTSPKLTKRQRAALKQQQHQQPKQVVSYYVKSASPSPVRAVEAPPVIRKHVRLRETEVSAGLARAQRHLAARERARGLYDKSVRGKEAGPGEEDGGGEKEVLGNDGMARLGKLYQTRVGGGGEAGQAKAEEQGRSIAEAMLLPTPTTSNANVSPPMEELALETPEPYQPQVGSDDITYLSVSDLEVKALNIPQPAVPPLQHGLDRVLFNQGVYQLQDAHSRVYNFDPYLQKIMPIKDFDFNKLKEYKTSSADSALSDLAKEHGSKFVGSTSSMTAVLAHFHYMLSNWRPLNLNMLSRGFKDETATFTQINRAPSAIFLRWKPESQTYAIDADKEFDSPNVLMMLGKSMEKVLTLPKEEFERYRVGNMVDPITEAEREMPEAFEYTSMGSLLMRSQLDAYNPNLPGTGNFDLKTRAALPIRMDAEGYEKMLGYEILTLQGTWESYEREYYDMMRSTMLKYLLQARMGRMDGIFVAYHNVERIFGFQYLPIAELDRAIHGQVEKCLGEQEFKASLKIKNEVLEMATQRFPGRSLRLHFESIDKGMPMMWIFAEPMEEEEINGIQSRSKERIKEFEHDIMGIEPDKSSAESGADNTTVEPAADGQEEVDYTTSNSPADPKFASEISSSATAKDEDWRRPLFAATLILMNYVNDVPCPNNRPLDLKPTDTWRVEYILKEAPLEAAEKWARYEDCKGRKRKVLERFREDGEEVEDKRSEWYFQFLQKMVQRGRTFRARVDELEEGREAVVIGMASADGGAKDGVEGVGGYMEWLYGHQRKS